MVYETIREFNPRESFLAVLTSEVALDIDNSIKGKEHAWENDAVQHLSRLLDEATQGERPLAKRPDICCILGDSISGREEGYWNKKTTGEVVLQTNLASKELRRFRELSVAQQEELRNFCVRLSQELVYNHSYFYSGSRRLAA
ncbi:MAG: hypothetical protein V1659_03925 [Candidatus Woesearchaeota archaeon]